MNYVLKQHGCGLAGSSADPGYCNNSHKKKNYFGKGGAVGASVTGQLQFNSMSY